MLPQAIPTLATPFLRSIRPTGLLPVLGYALTLLLILPAVTVDAALTSSPPLTDAPSATLTTAPKSQATALQPPMQFEPNLGQTDPHVKFMARGTGYTVLLTPNEAVLVLPSNEQNANSKRVVQLQVLGANPAVTMAGVDETSTTINRLIGADPTQWQTHVPVYAQVRYDQMYPGIDLLYYGNQQQLEYDFIVHPGADPSAIALGIQGADHATLDEDGHLVLSLESGTLRLQKPLLSQTVGGMKTQVEGSFILLEPDSTNPTAPPIRLAFAVGDYDPTLPLIIDPLVNYASALGGEGQDIGEAIALDNAGHGYVVGTTDSFTFPVTANALQDSAIGADRDLFVTKFDTETSELLFSTYIGGEGDDRATGVAVDASGIPYVTGHTSSLTFPTQNAVQETLLGAKDAFVLKLAADGSSLLYSTYLGGTSDDQANSIVVDALGQASLTGTTTSTDFPMVNAIDATLGNGDEATPKNDIFVTTLDAQGTSLRFSTFLGGTGADVGHSLALDTEGRIYLTGETTQGTGFPVSMGAFQPTYGGGKSDAFIATINPSLAGPAALQYASYLGGSGEEVGLDLLVDAQQQAFITGWTTGQGAAQAAAPSPALATAEPMSPWGRRSSPAVAVNPAQGIRGIMRNPVLQQQTPEPAPITQLSGSTSLPGFPVTSNAYDATFNGDKDAFLAHVNVAASGSDGLVYATYVGGSQTDTSTAISVDSLGRLCITGTTASPDYPVNNPFANQGTLAGGTDVFVTKFQPDPTTLLFSSFLGGSADDTVRGMRLDKDNNAYLTGQTRSTDFPLLTPLNNTTLTGEPLAFVMKVQDPVDITVTLIPTDTYLHLGEDYTWTLNWDNAGRDPATGVQVLFEFEESGFSPSIQFKSIQNISGSSAIDINSCSGSALSGPGGTLTCDVSDIPIAQGQSSAALTFTAVMDYDFYLSANMSGREVDTNPGNNEDSVTGEIGVDIFRQASLDIPQTFLADLDSGQVSVTGAPSTLDDDIWFEAETDLQRFISPRNMVRIALVGQTALGAVGCAARNLSQNRIPIQNVAVGDWICAQTTEGRIAEFRLLKPVGPSPGVLSIFYTVFELEDSFLTVDFQGQGTGKVEARPGPTTSMVTLFSVNGDKTLDYPNVTTISLTAIPDQRTFSGAIASTFTGWSGTGCTSTKETITVDMTQDRTCTATFTPIQRTLSVDKNGSGSGTMTSDPAGINCGNDCTQDYNDGTTVTLLARASNGSVFTRWGGACSGTNATATVQITQDRACTATFTTNTHTLTVTKAPNNGGSVTGTGINCGGDCTQDYNNGTSVTLTAAPGSGFTFTSWSGCDSTSGTSCTVTLNADRTATANFSRPQRTLSVTPNPNGTVSATGINCGNDCTQDYNDGTSVTLTAAASAGFTFSSWSGCDSTSGTSCTVTLNADRTVTVIFAGPTQRLTVTKSPMNAGSVSSTPVGINCGNDCFEDYSDGTGVTLTAAPSAGFTFSSWSGCDSTSGTSCTVTMNANRRVTGNFSMPQRTLTVTKAPNNGGTVTGTGINCGGDCSQTVDAGTSITLSAAPASGFSFTSWAGCNSTSGAQCTVTLTTSNRTATATFSISTVTVPTVVGQTQAAATATINAVNGLSVSGVTQATSGTVAAGNVISQNPTPGQVPFGSTVALVISTGVPLVTVPNVVGQPQAAATATINAVSGLSVSGVTQATSGTVAAGNVISQNPTPGQVPFGSTVALVVSSGPPPIVIVTVDVPDVAGQTQAAATTALTNAELTVGAITTQASGSVPSGSVISQDPVAGTNVPENSAVNLVISSGNELLVTMSEDSPDASPGDGVCATNTNVCTLRAAIQEANALDGEQTITLEPGTYTLTIQGANEELAARGDLDITDDVIIESRSGNAANVIIAAEALGDRVFDLPPGRSPNVTLRGLTIQGGTIVGSTGGGVRNAQSILMVEDSIVMANQSNGSGGGISQLDGTLTLRNTMVTNNTSQGLGGGLQAQSGTVTIDGNTQFTGNTANFGGGLSIGRANVTVTNTLVENNTAVGSGGGIYKFLSPGDLLDGQPSFNVQLSSTTVRNNAPNNCGGTLTNGCQ